MLNLFKALFVASNGSLNLLASAIVLMADGIPKILKSDISNDFKVSAKQIDDAISAKTKMIIINPPNNPSGSIYNKKESMFTYRYRSLKICFLTFHHL